MRLIEEWVAVRILFVGLEQIVDEEEESEGSAEGSAAVPSVFSQFHNRPGSE